MWTSAIFCAKNFGFFDIYGVSARTRGLSHSGHFADKGLGKSIFAICATSFKDGHLSRT